jgi:hypothetical protein
LEEYAYHGYKTSSFLSYASAYLEAAERLVETLQERPFDTLTLPIVFMYRHYLELTLKVLLHLGYKKYGILITPDLKKILTDHKIDILWEKLRPLLLQIFRSSEKEEEIDALESYIVEFSGIDVESMSFRYPVDKRGRAFLKNNSNLQSLEYIDVNHLAEKMASIDEFFTLSYMAFLTR